MLSPHDSVLEKWVLRDARGPECSGQGTGSALGLNLGSATFFLSFLIPKVELECTSQL